MSAREVEPPGDGEEFLLPPDPVESVFEQFNARLAESKAIIDAAEGARTAAIVEMWDAVCDVERPQGASTAVGSMLERSYGMHLASQLQIPRRTAAGMLHTALDLRAHLPLSFAAHTAGRFGWYPSKIIVAASTGLHGDELARFDAIAAERAVVQTARQLDRDLEKLRAHLDPAAAAERDTHARSRRGLSCDPLPDGQASFTLTGPATDIHALHDVAWRAAIAAHGRPGEVREMHELVYDVCVDMFLRGAATDAPADDAECTLDDPSTPGERLGSVRVPGRKAITARIAVTIPVGTAIGETDEPANLAGYGPIKAEDARRIIAAAKHWTRVVIDPVTNEILAADSRERYISAGLRKLIEIRDDTCNGPDCRVPAHRADIDHPHRTAVTPLRGAPEPAGWAHTPR